MNEYLKDLFRHNAWATKHLLTFCRELDERTLNTPVAGTFGTIMETFNHYLNSEGGYLRRASHAWPTVPWNTDELFGFEELSKRAAILAETWETFLSGEIDVNRLDEARGGDGSEYAVPVGVFIAQSIHHSNEHRAQICSALGIQGIEPPEVSGWLYGMQSERSTVTVWPEGAERWW